MTQYVPVPVLWEYQTDWCVWQVPSELDGIIIQNLGTFVEVEASPDGSTWTALTAPSAPLASYSFLRFRLSSDPGQLGQFVYLQPLPE